MDQKSGFHSWRWDWCYLDCLMFFIDLSLPSPEAITTEHFWRGGHIFHLSSGKGNLLCQENIARGILLCRSKRGGGLQGLLVFTRDNFILKLEFVSRALSKIGIQSMKLCKVVYIYCWGIQTDLDGPSVSYLYFSVTIFCFILLLSILCHFS